MCRRGWRWLRLGNEGKGCSALDTKAYIVAIELVTGMAAHWHTPDCVAGHLHKN
jgi:hypothetical protein